MTTSNMNRVIRRRDVEHATGLGRTTIYELVGKGSFPKPVRLSGNMVGWIEAEIDAWIAERIAARDTSTGNDDARSRQALKEQMPATRLPLPGGQEFSVKDRLTAFQGVGRRGRASASTIVHTED